MRVPQSLRDLIESAESIVYIEDLSNRRGILQTINPLAKLAAIAAMIVTSLFIFNLTYLSLLCVIPILLAISSKIPLRRFLSRITIIPLFAAIISLPILFMTVGQTIATINIGITVLTLTNEGIARFLVFSIRVWFCVASLTLLVLSTGFDKMLNMLSSIKVPSLIIQLFSLTYRYFFVSIHETQSVLIAKEARTYSHKKTINTQALKDVGSIISTLFIRTYERSERVYLAMKARGFQIETNAKAPTQTFHLHDIAFASMLVAPAVIFAII